MGKAKESEAGTSKGKESACGICVDESVFMKILS